MRVQYPLSRLSRLTVRATVFLLFVSHFYYHKQAQILIPPKSKAKAREPAKAKDHSGNLFVLPQKTPEEKVNKFYAWGDPNGINITSLLAYYEWLALEGIKKENWSFDNYPLVPVWISKDTHSKRFIVKTSMASFRKIPNANFLWRDRAVPMLNFMVDALNRPTNNHSKRKPPRHDTTKLFQLLEQAYDIPFLVDFGDVPSCGNNVFSTSSIVSPGHNLYNIQLPLFGMCRPRTCNYSFPLPTYLGLRLSKIGTNEWDNYFQNSDSLYPWKNKTKAGVWRGTTSGLNWTPNRAWLVEQGAQAPSVIDAEFATTKNTRIPFQDFQNFKAVIDMDGNGWSGRFLGLLCMNSVTLKIRPQFFDYNAAQLKEWTHYIPYDPKAFSDGIHNVSFPDFVENILKDENDAVLRKIVSNARVWCREHMSLLSIQDDLLDIFASFVAELDKNDASWEHKWMSSFSDIFDTQTFR